MEQPGVSVLILTLNEEVDLPACLESVSWCDDVVVFDSFSTDRTEQIATAAGARFFQHKFDNYASQRNASLEEVEYKYPWVFMLDADERFTSELVEEIARTLPVTDDDVSLFRLRRKDMFMGRWLRRSSGYPTWFGRMMRVGRVRFDREINEDTVTDGRAGFLNGHMVHHPFSKGLAYWFERHNRYSSMEAAALITEVSERMKFRDAFSSDPSIRRKTMKQLAYRMRFRPLLAFVYLYLLRAGFLDGLAGFRYCMLRFIYEVMIDMKVKELQYKARKSQ